MVGGEGGSFQTAGWRSIELGSCGGILGLVVKAYEVLHGQE